MAILYVFSWLHEQPWGFFPFSGDGPLIYRFSINEFPLSIEKIER